MSIFQKSILKQQKQDESLIALRWAEFQHFLAKREAIKDYKEEKYQEGFLKDVFENCLYINVVWFFIKNTSTEFRGGYFTFTTKQIEPFPLPELKSLEEQEIFVEKAGLMLDLNKKLATAKQNFINEQELEKIPKKLQNFENLEFDEFVKEYKKAKKLKFVDKLQERNFKQEWQALFENDKKEVQELQKQINKTDKEIDQMVYKLYDLTDDEIKIVESS